MGVLLNLFRAEISAESSGSDAFTGHPIENGYRDLNALFVGPTFLRPLRLELLVKKSAI